MNLDLEFMDRNYENGCRYVLTTWAYKDLTKDAPMEITISAHAEMRDCWDRAAHYMSAFARDFPDEQNLFVCCMVHRTDKEISRITGTARYSHELVCTISCGAEGKRRRVSRPEGEPLWYR